MPKPKPREEQPGREMIVVPEPTRARMRRDPLLAPLHVTDAGFFARAAWHHVVRPRGAPTTLLILCLHGRGWVDLPGGRLSLEPGCFAWLPAGKPHAYGTDPQEAWSISWAHFDGSQVAHWEEALGFRGGAHGWVRQVPVSLLGEIPLGQVHSALKPGYARKELLASAGWLGACLGLLARHAAQAGSQGNRSARERVAASIERLRLHWREAHRLNELAAEAGLSTAQYSALFKEQSGFAPIDFLIRQRIGQACQLLDGSRLPVAQIAGHCGYEDPYYFTRCFRRVMGQSPRAYRNTPKG